MSLQKSYKMQSCSWCYFSHPITERLQNLREEVGNNERDTIRRTSVRGFIHNLDLQKVKIALILKPRLSYTNHRICNANAIWRIFNPNFFMSDGKPHLETFLNHVWLLLLTDSVVCDAMKKCITRFSWIFWGDTEVWNLCKTKQNLCMLCEIPQKSISQRHMTLHLPIIIDSCEHFFLHLWFFACFCDFFLKKNNVPLHHT